MSSTTPKSHVAEVVNEGTSSSEPLGYFDVDSDLARAQVTPYTATNSIHLSESQIPLQFGTSDLSALHTVSENLSTPFTEVSASTHGFLGSTSYSAVFTESQGQLDVDIDHAPTVADHYNNEKLPTTSAEHAKKIKQGAQVLAQLRDFEHLRDMYTDWLQEVGDLPLMGPFVPACAESIKMDILEKFDIDSEQGQLEASKTIFNITGRPFKIPRSCTLQGFHKLFTGDNLRWEAIGHFFTACGLACMNMQYNDPRLGFVGRTPPRKLSLSHRLLDASNACVTFCQETGCLNDIGMLLAHENCTLMSQVLGDASKYHASAFC